MKTRIEHDLLGEKEVPADAYYGIQTLRGIENFQNISGITIGDYPNYVKALAMVKWAAAKANQELEILPDDIANAIYPGLLRNVSEANSMISSRSI